MDMLEYDVVYCVIQI